MSYEALTQIIHLRLKMATDMTVYIGSIVIGMKPEKLASEFGGIDCLRLKMRALYHQQNRLHPLLPF